MARGGRRACGAVAALLLWLWGVPACADPAAEWVDPTTGHRVLRISREPGTVSLYFTQNSFLPQGDALAVTTPAGIALVDLAHWTMRPLVSRPGAVMLFAGRRTRTIYFADRARDDAGGPFGVYAVNADSGAVRRVATVPGRMDRIDQRG